MQEYIDNLNKDNNGCFKIASASHFEEMGITTVKELEEYFDQETYVNIYKDKNGFKPNISGMSAEDLRKGIEDLCSIKKESPVEKTSNTMGEQLKAKGFKF